jgi:tRNA(fMet)-specific endonuclease VapC
MVRYLLDTNIILEILKKPASPDVLSRFHHYQNEVALAATVWHELWFGCHRLPLSRRRSELEHFLNNILALAIPILPFDATAAYWLATERTYLVNRGLPPAMTDGQIAAVAATNALVLVTRNVADFISFRGLAIENWFDA